MQLEPLAGLSLRRSCLPTLLRWVPLEWILPHPRPPLLRFCPNHPFPALLAMGCQTLGVANCPLITLLTLGGPFLPFCFSNFETSVFRGGHHDQEALLKQT